MYGNSKILLMLLIFSSIFLWNDGLDDNLIKQQKQIPYKINQLSDDKFFQYSKLSDTRHLKEAIKNIMIPRVVGTENHAIVREYIVGSLRKLNWAVEIDSFHDTAPIFGQLHFHNIIAKLNPNAERYLVLACHYDSKYFANINFLGAIDSAVPCAMLLNLAHVLQQPLQPIREAKLSLMLIFFDGEEAFKKWGPTDSLYGARHLAEKWAKQNFLGRIDMLMLLDLLGAPDPNFYSFFRNTDLWFSELIAIEVRLAEAGILQHYSSSGVSQYDPNRYYQSSSLRSALIEDDHIPFMERGVPILHIIPIPFPDVWHTKDDNGSIIDYTTTENLALIVRLFTLEYLLQKFGNIK